MSIGLAIQGAGAAIKAYGAFTARKEEQYTNEYNAVIVRSNERIRQASMQLDINRAKRQADKAIGTSVAVAAKTGLEISGSIADVIQENIKELSLDIEIMEINKKLSQFQANQKASQLEAAAKKAKSRAWKDAVGSIIGSASSMASSGSFGSMGGIM